jgi:aldehyde:ferredoxin oxidoreductase
MPFGIAGKGLEIDLYQKNIITQADTDGLELNWQDRQAAFKIIEKIAKREDIGDILAYGVVEASKIIGRDDIPVLQITCLERR